MAEELEEEEQPRATGAADSDRRIVARFLDLVAAAFVALAVATGSGGEYGRATTAFLIGFGVFLCGIFWDRIRSVIDPGLTGSILRVASDARSWLTILFIVFSYIAAPSFVTRITHSPEEREGIGGVNAKINQKSLGPQTVSKMVAELKESIDRLPGMPPWHVVITTAKENEKVAHDLQSLFTLSTKNVAIVPLPDYDRDIDAPKFVQNNQISGVILHGRNQLSDVLKKVWGNCFTVRQASDVSPNVTQYYGFVLTWIEVGPESPWRTPDACSD